MTEPRYVRAASVDEAISALREAGGDGLVVAGGVVVGSLFNQRLASPSVLVDITRIADLQGIGTGPDGGLVIGALATHEDVLRSPAVKAAAPLLAEIAEEVSCPRLRNRGTIGGSVCTIGGQGDPATGLIALGATLHIRGPAGTRTAALEDFYKDAFEVDLRPEEIVEHIAVPPMPAGARSGFHKLGPRNAMDWTQITASVVLVRKGNAFPHVRVGMNGVASTPNRPRAVERLLMRSDADRLDWRAIAEALDGEISPQGDLVYSEGHKRRLAVVALRRAMERAASTGGSA